MSDEARSTLDLLKRTGPASTPATPTTVVRAAAEPAGNDEPGPGRGAAPSDGPGHSRLWILYLVIATLLSIAYFCLPAYHLVLWTPLGLSSVVATTIGLRRHRPRQRVAWWLLACAELSFIAGDTTYNVLTDVLHEDNPFPSIADLFYLLNYPVFSAGIFLFIRGRSSTRDRASLIDAIIITTGLGLLSWVYLIVPNYQADGLTSIQRLTSVAYPLGDVLILAMLARLVGGGGLRVRSMQFLLLGGVGLITADVLYGLLQLNGTWAVGGPVDLGWVIFYVAWGCAALHPSMVQLGEIPPRRAVQMGPFRVGLLATVSLIAPAVLMASAVSGSDTHAVTISLFSTALFLLVIARLWGILKVHQQSIARERILRSTSEALLAAPGMAEIYEVALAGVRSLTGPTEGTAALYVAREGRVSSVGRFGIPSDPEPLEQYWQAAASGGELNAAGTISVSPIGHDASDRRMLIVESPTPLSLDQHSALSTLAAQVALAVESADLAEDLRVRRNEERFRGILQNTSDIIVIVNSDGEITYSTPSLGRAVGCAPDDVLGRNLTEFLHENDSAEASAIFAGPAASFTQRQSIADWRLRRTDGSLVAFEVLSNNLLGDPRVGGIVLTMRDVSERRALEEQLKHQAFHDALTGLPNRALFQDRAEHALARRSRVGGNVAMVMLDIDDFKIINDTRGHAAGDELLLQVAERLQASLRADATVARFGGDEFAILVEDLADPQQAENLAARALQVYATPFAIDGEEVTAGASIGLVVAGGNAHVVDTAELIRCADVALYAAKERGKGQVVRYHLDLQTQMLDRLNRRSDLERAVAGHEFVLQYQPIVLIETGEVVGSETLVRWQHPDRGLVAPMDFVPLAEDTGLIGELGGWVLDQACAQLSEWTAVYGTDLRLSVNVSARQLHDGGFVDDVRAVLARHQVNPAQLVLELTESIFAFEGPSVREQLAALRDLGVKIAMDDFGTGYSSLSYLQQFQLDILKVDKSFVDRLGTGEPDGSALVTAIISLGHSLRLEVVAEGIEHSSQRDELWSMGCTYGQGHLYSRPVGAEQMAALLASSPQLGGPVPGHHNMLRVDSASTGAP